MGRAELVLSIKDSVAIAVRLLRDRDGVTAVEYALIAALVVVAAIAAVTLTGTNISKTFSTIANKL